MYRARQRERSPGRKAKVVLQRIWHALYDDTKRSAFRQENKKLGMTQADLLKIFIESGVEPDLQWRVVPREPVAGRSSPASTPPPRCRDPRSSPQRRSSSP